LSALPNKRFELTPQARYADAGRYFARLKRNTLGGMESVMRESAKETWDSGSPYELYVGRWSRRVARGFLAWLAVPSGQRWGDVGCGTGALVESILTLAEP
jgi:predicted TPR repeat methyltransferase